MQCVPCIYSIIGGLLLGNGALIVTTYMYMYTNPYVQELSRAGVLIFANKQDVKGSMSAAEISQHLNLTSIKDHGWHIQSCCALTGEG